MGWFRKEQVPSPDSLSLPSAEWELNYKDDSSISWMALDKVAVRVICLSGSSPVPEDLPGATKFYEIESKENGGVLIEAEFVSTEAGRVFRSVHKYQSPENPLNAYIVGIILLTWKKFHIRIHTEAIELGSTGGREAGVALVNTDQPPEPPVESEEVTTKQLFDKLRAGRIAASPSDAAKWDRAFPQHPLSRVRSIQTHIIGTMTTDLPPSGT